MTDAASRTSAASGAAVLDLLLAEPRQLYNTMDPAPFRSRDLDPGAEAYIVAWAREVRTDQALVLRITLESDDGTGAMIGDAVRAHFAHCAETERRRLAQLFRTGRISLAIGLAVLAAAIILADLVSGMIARERTATIVEETLVIGGWVALWHPMQIYLYDWWPIRAEARLFDRLAAAAVQVAVRGAKA